MNENDILLYQSGELDESSRNRVEQELAKEENSELRGFHESLQQQEAFFESAVPEVAGEGVPIALDLNFILKSASENTQNDQAERKLIQWKPIIAIASGLAIAACFVVIFTTGTQTGEQDVIVKEETENAAITEKSSSLSKYLEFKKRRQFDDEVSEIRRNRGTKSVLNPRKSLARY